MIKTGSLFVLTCGEYSDYQMLTLCRAKIDFDVGELEKLFLSSRGNQRVSWGYSEFLLWLFNGGYAEELNYWEWHLGTYGDIEFTIDEKIQSPRT